jgi:DNA-binding NtrC family response regulator
VERFRQATGKAIEGISSEAMAAVLRYAFPGNIRELENLVERAFILCDRAEIGLDHLPPKVAAAGRQALPESRGERSLDRLEDEAIRAALARHGGNRTLAARDLGIHRTTLLRKVKRLQS